MVDSIAGPAAGGDARRGGPLRRHERPVFLPRGALRDPLLEQADLAGGEPLAGLLGRHPLRRIGRGDAADELAPFGPSRNDGEAPSPVGERDLRHVQAKVGHARGPVRAVALKAIVGEDRKDVSIEVNSRGEWLFVLLGLLDFAREHAPRGAQGCRQEDDNWTCSQRWPTQRHFKRLRILV